MPKCLILLHAKSLYSEVKAITACIRLRSHTLLMECWVLPCAQNFHFRVISIDKQTLPGSYSFLTWYSVLLCGIKLTLQWTRFFNEFLLNTIRYLCHLRYCRTLHVTTPKQTQLLNDFLLSIIHVRCYFRCRHLLNAFILEWTQSLTDFLMKFIRFWWYLQ